MAVGSVVHYIGVLFVVVAFILLLISCIGAPAVNHIGLLDVHLKNASTAVFGPFGYCVRHVAQGGDMCSHPSVGYIPAQEMRLLDPDTTWTTWRGHNLDLMTMAYVLFPIACAITFFAAAFAFCGVIGSLIASVLSATAFLIVLIVMIVAFVSFGYLKSHVQSRGLKSNYGAGMWTMVAAFVLLFLAMFLLLFSCLGARKKHRNRRTHTEKGHWHRKDSDRSLDHDRNHHLGRDAALGTAGVGAYEADKHHHRNQNGTYVDPSRDHHHQQHPHEHHLGRDAALGAAGAGAYAAHEHHRNQNNGGPIGSRDNHYGRDGAVVGGAYDNRDDGRHHLLGGQRRAPANPAAARAMEGLRGASPNEYGRDSALSGSSGGVMGVDDHGRNTGTVTHHTPTITTSTSTYADERGVVVDGPHTSSYDPVSGERRRY